MLNSQENVMDSPLQEPKGKWKRLLRKRVPIIVWLPKYDKMTALADLVAGITLGLTLVPQSIAYASLANLPVHYGLYSAFMGTLVYVVFGTVKEVSIGPTSLMALLTLQACRDLPIEYVVLLTFLSGCVVMVMGLLRLGFLVELISQPVTSGFTSGTVVIIVMAQLKGLLGLKFSAENVIEVVKLLREHIRDVRLYDSILSVTCITVILCLRQLKDLKINQKRCKLKKALWLLSISRNAIVVCAAATFAYCLTEDMKNPIVKLSGSVEPGLPPFQFPSLSVVTKDNTTVYFPEMVKELGLAVVMAPVVMVLANVAIAKAFSSGRSLDATQEMLTLGLCNLMGSLVHSMPTCGAFTRSAVSHSSGVRTPAAGLYSAVITLLALAFMTKYFYFIPKATLSSVLVCAIIFMFDMKIFFRLWCHSKPDFIVVSLTFLVSVFWTVEMAVLTGVAANIAALLYSCARVPLDMDIVKVPGVGECIRVTPSLSLVYLNIERFKNRVLRIATSAPMLIDCSRILLIDYSASQGLEQLSTKFKSNGQKLIFYNASLEVMKRLENAEWLDSRQLQSRSEVDAIFINNDIALSTFACTEETSNLLEKEHEVKIEKQTDKV